MEQSAQSAPTHFADPRYTADDSAWETVVKKGNKGSKASTAPKPGPPAAPPATAAASQTLQPQSSGLSQTGRTASGVLPQHLVASQQSGGVQASGGGHSARAKSADRSSAGGDGGLSGDSASVGHMRRISQDEDALSTRSSIVDRSLFQQQSRPESAESSSAAVQEAAGRAGLPGPAPAAKPSNWAGLLKPPQQQQDVQQGEASSQKVAPPIVSEGAFPQLTGAAASLTPSQLSLSSEFKPQGLLEADPPSIPGPPCASAGHAHHAHRGPGSNGSGTTAESAASEQRSQVQFTQQLHANAAIWGTSLSAGTLTGIQLPQQQQISVNPFQAASSASSSAAPPAGLWEAQSTLVLTPQSALPRPPSQAPPKPPGATPKSALPVDAQPFIPQAHLSNPASQGQRLPFTPQEGVNPNQQLGNQPQAGTTPHQQGMPTSVPFMQSHSFSRPQPPSSASGGYRSNGVFDSLSHPQQQQLNSLNRGLDGNAALQQMQRQRLLQQQQQQQQASLLPRHLQQQQLADIWLQPSVALKQNGSTSRATGAFAAHQQPANAKGKGVPNGPFAAAHQSAAAAFHQQQQQQQAPFLQQQYSGLHSQSQSRSNRQGLNGSVNGNQYANVPLNGSGVNGTANGHLSSAGTQSEEDELLSGVFAKVWEDNLQVMQCALHADGVVTATYSQYTFLL